MVTRSLLYGRMMDGQILGEITPSDYSWADVNNDAAGSISATIPGTEVRRLNLRQEAAAERCFLAVEEGGRIRQAGPIHGYNWDWQTQQLTLAAGDFWSYLDRRVVHNPNDGGAPLATTALTLSGPDLQSIVVQLLDTLYLQGYFPSFGDSDVPATPATITRTWYGYALGKLGDALRDITKEGLDIRFRPARDLFFNHPTALRWVMETGTAASPLLAQIGDDWVFDATAPKSPVRGVTVDGDGSKIANTGWIAGSGSETQTVMDYWFTDAGKALLDAGYPVLDVVAPSLPQEQDVNVLNATLVTLLNNSARPVEAWKVDVDAEATLEVKPGDHCQLVLADDPYLGDVDARMRIAKVSGSYASSTVTLDMYPVEATL